MSDVPRAHGAGVNAAPIRRRGRVWEWIVPLGLAGGGAGLFYFASGPSLGAFFGPFFVAALVVAALRVCGYGVVSILLGFVLGTGAVWLAAASQPDVYVADVPKSLLVLLAFVAALLGASAICHAARCGAMLNVAIVGVLALAWLTWPVWLTEVLETSAGQTCVNWLVPAHPLFAVNSVLHQFGPWDHYPALAYPQLTVLNQDVSYNLPTTIWPAILLHLLIGCSGLAAAKLTGTRAKPTV